MDMALLKAILTFCGGLGLFIFGMEIMAEGLQQAAGSKTRRLLESLTKSRWRAVLCGALVTAVIQSSSAVTVMVVGFVNAALMSLTQACGVIMGANIGTTMTAWIVSMGEWAAFLKPEMIAPGLLLAGVAMNLFSKKQKIRQTGRILIGFGMLFTGLSSMSAAVKPYTDSEIFKYAFTYLGANPLMGILVGALVTAVIQSSSASMGILQTLAAAGAVNWGSAVFIALGQNIGTCVTALISSISGDTNAKRAAMIHLEFNVIGAMIAAAAAMAYFAFVPDMLQAHVGPTALAIFHTIFNVAVTLILFPFANGLVSLSKILVPECKNSSARKEPMLDERFLSVPAAALNAVRQEFSQIGARCLDLISQSAKTLQGQDAYDQEMAKETGAACKMVRDYLSRIETASLNPREQTIIQKDLLKARDFLQISTLTSEVARIAPAIAERSGKQNPETEVLAEMLSLCSQALSLTLKKRHAPDEEVLKENVKGLCRQVFVLESKLGQTMMEDPETVRAAKAWDILEAADDCRQIAVRILRIHNEISWKKSRLLPAVQPEMVN